MDRTVATSAEEALKILPKSGARLIVVDRDLPGAERLITQIRNNHKLSIVVAATGDMQMGELSLLEAGANAVLRYPPTSEWEDKLARFVDVAPRKDVRVHIDVSVETLFGVEGVACRVVNLSRCGMLLESPHKLALGDHVDFKLHINSSTTIAGKARVVRMAGVNRYGCEFVGLDGYDTRRLEFFLGPNPQ